MPRRSRDSCWRARRCWSDCRRARSRTEREQAAAEALHARAALDARRRFLLDYVNLVYEELTDGLRRSVRVEDLVYLAAERYPGLTPTPRAGAGRASAPAEGQRGLRDRPGPLRRLRAEPAAGGSAPGVRDAATPARVARRPRRVPAHGSSRHRADQRRTPRQRWRAVAWQSPISERRGRLGRAQPRDRHRPDPARSDDRDRRAARQGGRAPEVRRPPRVQRRHQPDPPVPRADRVHRLLHRARHGLRQQDVSRAVRRRSSIRWRSKTPSKSHGWRRSRRSPSAAGARSCW